MSTNGASLVSLLAGGEVFSRLVSRQFAMEGEGSLIAIQNLWVLIDMDNKWFGG